MRKRISLLILFGIFYGISLHDFIHQAWELKGTFFSLEGGYIGFIGMLFTLLLYLFLGWKK